MNVANNTHIGKRETNQDYIKQFYNQSGQLLSILCDGMGGHNGGDVASEMAVLQLGNNWEDTTFNQIETLKRWLDKAINKENKRIFDAATVFNDLKGMGTTIVTVAFLEEIIVIGNIGDSRAYQLTRNKVLHQITEDHSFANELRMSGQITDEEAISHKKKNTLTRSLGVGTNVQVDFFECSVKETEAILICSDGLTNTVSSEEITETIAGTQDIQKKVEKLIELALANGAEDNISVTLIEEIDLASKVSEKGGVVE